MPAMYHELVKRGGKHNFAYKNPGVILVFAILGAIGFLIIGLVTYKKITNRRARNHS